MNVLHHVTSDLWREIWMKSAACHVHGSMGALFLMKHHLQMMRIQRGAVPRKFAAWHVRQIVLLRRYVVSFRL